MKKNTLLLMFLMTALIALNGCTVAIINEDENTQGEKEVFAVENEMDESEKLPEQTDSAHGMSHKYTVESFEEEFTAPDGTLLAIYDYSYPVFQCNEGDNAEYVATINEMFKNNALEHVNDAKHDFKLIEDEYEDSQKNGYWFNPHGYSYSFDIHTDAMGILSVTENRYYYTGGAHGGTVRISHNYDVVEGKELMLSDLLYGTEQDITRAFTQEFLKVKEEFFDDPEIVVPKELSKAQFYVDGDGVTAYFQQYQVGSYAAGFVSATISDKEMLKYDFSTTEE